MELGLNLSFATKRWLDPKQLAYMCRHEFDVTHIQFTWDLIDPWWPEEPRNLLVKAYKDAFAAEGLIIDATFGGLAAYTYAQLLAPTREQREIAVTFFKRAIDLTAAMGASVMGTPAGGMSAKDASDEGKKAERYQEMLSLIRQLAEYAKEKGLKELHIEATPLANEFPYCPKAAVRMMEDLEDTAIPIKLLIDWGHALYQPLLKEEADMQLWLTQCSRYVGAIHLQQTDGLLDRHWDFTKSGIVTPQLIKAAGEVPGLETVVQYLEVVTAFESTNEEVYEGMKKTMAYLHQELAC